MAEGFGVTPAALSAVATGIGRVIGPVGTTDAPRVSGDAVGHEGFASALAEFGHRWDRGRHCLVSDGNRFAGGLSRCATAYQRVERAIAEGLPTAGP